MSNTSDRSTESEDGEIDRHMKTSLKRSGERGGEGYRPQYESKHRKRHKSQSPDLQYVSDENHSTPDREEYEEEEEDDEMLDETNEEGLDIKPPQHKASTSSRHKNYSVDYNYRNTSDKSLNRSAKEAPFERPKDRHRDKHRNRSRYSDNRSAKSEEDFRRRRREDETEVNVNPNRSRNAEKQTLSERWMVLDEKNSSSDNWRSKSSELTTSRSHKQRHNKELEPSRERSRKSPQMDKSVPKVMDSSNTSNILSTVSVKQTAKKLNAMLEVQEVEMSEEEMVSDEHSVDKSTDRSDVSESDDNEPQEAEEAEQEIQEDYNVIKDNKSDDNIPRIVVDHDVVYYSESNVVEKSAKSGDELEELGDDMSDDLPDYYPAIQGCRSVEEFQCINRIEEGTYGVVYRAREKRTNETVALKRLKMEKEKEGFPITSLREISTLLKAQHENIVAVREIVVGSNMDKIFIVMEFVEHDLKSLMETMKQPFLLGEVKTLMQQLLRAVAHLHDNWILHRDLKTSNLLLSHKGILKVGDFGLAREYGSPLKAYTPIVVTLWYRSPELLLQTKQYSYPIDIWSVGCIFGEFLTMKPLFPGKSEIDQLNAIFKDLGTPNDKIWPEYSELPLVKKVTFADHKYNNMANRLGQKLTKKGFDLLNRFLTYCPSRRITAEEALKHEFFNESPLPIDPSMFPTWPAKSEQSGNSQPRKAHSPKPPSGGKQFAKQLAGDDYEKLIEGQGFHMSYAAHGNASKGGSR
ncbi:unnamed protein product [Medioppia subpectinata]|uniref:cyclin-dependent kinase n=1 Tax=Medioppia subpectinata TaxID=1979941 RepID=A0A7R9KGH1_9ACAR|nr:unnamed protein product [Medioppia subpectinata]CAG2102913.1 unnamed protein product [Medioppia subpectinata]